MEKLKFHGILPAEHAGCSHKRDQYEVLAQLMAAQAQALQAGFSYIISRARGSQLSLRDRL